MGRRSADGAGQLALKPPDEFGRWLQHVGVDATVARLLLEQRRGAPIAQHALGDEEQVIGRGRAEHEIALRHLTALEHVDENAGLDTLKGRLAG
ncbi:hypothetical protein D9M68_918010 [compost metagenome]